ncbi:hypothetical protein [Frigoribacterium faeni]|nr:hypothetical protein [Frigoribacterium faeni]MBA8813127.1 hypothetical protein [Frigoribacterium faeni]
MTKAEKQLIVILSVTAVFAIVLIALGQPIGWLMLISGAGCLTYFGLMIRKRRRDEQSPTNGTAPATDAAQATDVPRRTGTAHQDAAARPADEPRSPSAN